MVPVTNIRYEPWDPESGFVMNRKLKGIKHPFVVLLYLESVAPSNMCLSITSDSLYLAQFAVSQFDLYAIIILLESVKKLPDFLIPGNKMAFKVVVVLY